MVVDYDIDQGSTMDVVLRMPGGMLGPNLAAHPEPEFGPAADKRPAAWDERILRHSCTCPRACWLAGLHACASYETAEAQTDLAVPWMWAVGDILLLLRAALHAADPR